MKVQENFVLIAIHGQDRNIFLLEFCWLPIFSSIHELNFLPKTNHQLALEGLTPNFYSFILPSNGNNFIGIIGNAPHVDEVNSMLVSLLFDEVQFISTQNSKPSIFHPQNHIAGVREKSSCSRLYNQVGRAEMAPHPHLVQTHHVMLINHKKLSDLVVGDAMM